MSTTHPAQKAVEHILQTLRESPERFYLLGDATESFALLTQAYALDSGLTVEEVEDKFRPPKDIWERWLNEKEATEKLVTKLRENQDVTIGLMTPAGICFESWWLETGQFLEPVASTRGYDMHLRYRDFAKRVLEESGLEVE